ncbi:MAG: hypothetical protein OXG35_11705 [Acidobacteria bacterium]|nr:hypothetical protein [Acidobacteriota bacterium]
MPSSRPPDETSRSESGYRTAGDHGTLAGITIPAQGLSATGTITTTDDTDADDEQFTVALGALPSVVAAGATTSVQITITDDDTSQEQSGGTGTLMERCASYLPSNAVSVAEGHGLARCVLPGRGACAALEPSAGRAR